MEARGKGRGWCLQIFPVNEILEIAPFFPFDHPHRLTCLVLHWQEPSSSASPRLLPSPAQEMKIAATIWEINLENISRITGEIWKFLEMSAWKILRIDFRFKDFI